MPGSGLLDRDFPDLGLRLGSLGQLDRQNPVLEGGLRLFAIHTGGERNCPVDRAVAALGEIVSLLLLLALDLLLPFTVNMSSLTVPSMSFISMPGSSIDTSIALSVSTTSDFASPLPKGHSK